MNTSERIKQLRTQCDNYNQGLEALKALAHALLWDSANETCITGGIAHFGRRMHTSPQNRIAPSRKVTPDLVAQRCPDSGFVVEMKASVPENETYRRERLREVQKYDDDLSGWQKTPMRRHDVILLVDYGNSTTVRQDIETMVSTGEITWQGPFALVCFSHPQRAEGIWIALQLLQGSISDGEKHRILHKICMIHPEDVAANPLFGRVSMYDACPPLPLLMDRLYGAVNSNLSDEDHLKLRTEGQVTKTYRLAELKDMLADYCCPEQTDPKVPKLPATDWIKKAVAMWIRLGWAIRSPDSPGSVDVIIKKTRRQPFEQFLKVCAEEDCKRAHKKEREQERKRAADEKFQQEYPLFVLFEEHAEKKVSDGADPADPLTLQPEESQDVE